MRMTTRAWIVASALLAASAASAADKPDTLALLKNYPSFARITKETRLSDGDVNIIIRLCRGANRACEMFTADGDDIQTLTDYVYLFATYKGGYAEGKPTSRNGQALVEEADTRGYGKALLDFYQAKYSCQHEKDGVACVMHGLWTEGSIKRQVYVDEGGGDFGIVGADEDGNTIFEY